MPNSRLEVSPIITPEIIEALGVWMTTGNNLLAGGGQILGSKDNFGYFFIANDVKIGGFFNSGEFFLSQDELNPDHRAVFKTIKFETNDDTDQNPFIFTLPNKTIYNFKIGLQFRSANGASWGRLVRTVSANREAGLMDITKNTYPESERVGANNVETVWEKNGLTVRLKVNGLPATNLKWSGLIQYQGIANF